MEGFIEKAGDLLQGAEGARQLQPQWYVVASKSHQSTILESYDWLNPSTVLLLPSGSLKSHYSTSNWTKITDKGRV